MTTRKLDDKGRLVLPKNLREKYGNKFELIQNPEDIVLRPLSKYPIDTKIKDKKSEGKW